MHAQYMLEADGGRSEIRDEKTERNNLQNHWKLTALKNYVVVWGGGIGV